MSHSVSVSSWLYFPFPFPRSSVAIPRIESNHVSFFADSVESSNPQCDNFFRGAADSIGTRNNKSRLKRERPGTRNRWIPVESYRYWYRYRYNRVSVFWFGRETKSDYELEWPRTKRSIEICFIDSRFLHRLCFCTKDMRQQITRMRFYPPLLVSFSLSGQSRLQPTDRKELLLSLQLWDSLARKW